MTTNGTASVYDQNGEILSAGLQPSSICDAAIIAAKRLAAHRNEAVIFEDDGYWLVSANGTVEAATAAALGFDPAD